MNRNLSEKEFSKNNIFMDIKESFMKRDYKSSKFCFNNDLTNNQKTAHMRCWKGIMKVYVHIDLERVNNHSGNKLFRMLNFLFDLTKLDEDYEEGFEGSLLKLIALTKESAYTNDAVTSFRLLRNLLDEELRKYEEWGRRKWEDRPIFQPTQIPQPQPQQPQPPPVPQVLQAPVPENLGRNEEEEEEEGGEGRMESDILDDEENTEVPPPPIIEIHNENGGGDYGGGDEIEVDEDDVLEESDDDEDHEEKTGIEQRRSHKKKREKILKRKRRKKRKLERKKKERTREREGVRRTGRKRKRSPSSSSEMEISTGGEESDLEPKKKKRKKNERFTETEMRYLRKGYRRYGPSNWESIRKHGTYQFHPSRNGTSLRDKWRNMKKFKKRRRCDESEMSDLSDEESWSPSDENNEEETKMDSSTSEDGEDEDEDVLSFDEDDEEDEKNNKPPPPPPTNHQIIVLD